MTMFARLLILACQAQDPGGYEALLERMIHPIWMAELPAPEERVLLFSSRDPRSSDASGDPDAWFSEDDSGHFLGTHVGTDGPEHVMVEASGPGFISRLRLDSARGQLRFYVDGSDQASLDLPAMEFFDGTLAPVPFGRLSGGGGVFSLPIPFTRSIRVTTTDGDARYAVSVQMTNLAEGVPALTREVLERHRDPLLLTARQLMASSDPLVQRKTKWMGAVDFKNEFPVSLRGNGAVHWFRFSFIGVDAPLDQAELPEYLRAIRIQTMDHTESAGEQERILIDVPFGDFFAASVAQTPVRSATLGFNPVGQSFYCRLPMPYEEGFTLKLVNDRELPKTVRVRLDVGFEQLLQPPPLRLRAAYFQHRNVPTRPAHDQTLFQASGAGRLIGLGMTVLNEGRRTWANGDEKIWVDGESTPSWFGTGLTDYFDRTIWHEGPEHFGYTALLRSHLSDPVAFRSGLRFDVGVVHPDDCQVHFEGVALWYGDPDFPLPVTMPSGEERVLQPIPEASFEYVPGALDLATVQLKKFGGEGDFRGLVDLPPAWSGSADQVLLIENAAPGSYASMKFPFLRSGAFHVKARMLGGGGGQVRFRINGRRMARTIELPQGDAQLVDAEIGIIQFSSSSSHSLILEVVEGAEFIGMTQLVLVPVES